LQLPFRTSSSVDAYIRNREWRYARLAGCPVHPSGGCAFARHGSYARATPRGLRIARWYCPEGRRTFSLLPDFLAARLLGPLASIEESVTIASSAKSMEAAADALRGPDVTLPSAVRWLRRRVQAFRMALRHVVAPETVIGRHARERTSGNDIEGGHLLLGLRQSLPLQMLNRIPAPLGFKPAWDVGRPGDGGSQHKMGSDEGIAGHYGSQVEGNRVRWTVRVSNVLPKSCQAQRTCFGSGTPIAVCGTAAPASTCNGSGDSVPIARDRGSVNVPS
jgi:hypothetical protein